MKGIGASISIAFFVWLVLFFGFFLTNKAGRKPETRTSPATGEPELRLHSNEGQESIRLQPRSSLWLGSSDSTSEDEEGEAGWLFADFKRKDEDACGGRSNNFN